MATTRSNMGKVGVDERVVCVPGMAGAWRMRGPGAVAGGGRQVGSTPRNI
jgi:hypothetical protein